MTIQTKTPTGLPAAFLNDVLKGLSEPQKAISPRWLYDQAGSELFEEITELPEYYVTRTEVALLGNAIADLVGDIGPGATVVEFGAGAAVKIRYLLDALDRPATYVALDISYPHLVEAVKPIAQAYPKLNVVPVEGDFIDGPVAVELPHGGPRVGFFPGSTIGNMSDSQIDRFLRRSGQILGDRSYLLLGADLRKSPDVLIPAYDDAAGVTAAFNLNLLTRINRELDGSIERESFAHRAIWNDAESRIEMHLESLRDQRFMVAGQPFSMTSGETIHTENSRKFTRTDLEYLALRSGWRISRWQADQKDYFAVLMLERY